MAMLLVSKFPFVTPTKSRSLLTSSASRSFTSFCLSGKRSEKTEQWLNHCISMTTMFAKDTQVKGYIIMSTKI